MQKIRIILLSGLICLLTGVSVLAAGYNEAPMLKTRVAAGELPPVEKRLPEEPFVVEPFEEIGQYGGTLYVYARNETIWNDLSVIVYGEPTLAKQEMVDADGKWWMPQFIKDYDFSNDFKTLTMYLRKGGKWSDGEPFTAEDFTFYWVDCKSNFFKEVPLPLESLPYGLKEVEKIDDYTVRFHFSDPAPAGLGEFMHVNYGEWGPFSPKHYLKKWHIKYNPKANELAKEEGFENWWEALQYHRIIMPHQNDMNLPATSAWVLTHKTLNIRVFERNPYYFAVDTNGNQLPYIDRIISEVVSPEVYELKAISGAADYGQMGITFPNYPLYKKNEENGDYRIIFVPGSRGSEVGIFFNWFDQDLIQREIYRDIRFRRAMSLGIDREEINEMIFFGQGVPRQGILLMESFSFYKKEWDEYYTQYDPERANILLTEIGLKWDKNHEYRLRPDGETFTLVVEYAGYGYETAVLELVRKQYLDLGIKVILKQLGVELYSEHMEAATHSVGADQLGYANVPWCWLDPKWAYPSEHNVFARPWAQWLESGGTKGEEPPADFREQYARIQKLRSVPMLSEEAARLFVEITEFALEKLWSIGIVGKVPKIVVVKNRLRNVWDCKPYETESGRKIIGGEPQRWYDQWFWK